MMLEIHFKILSVINWLMVLNVRKLPKLIFKRGTDRTHTFYFYLILSFSANLVNLIIQFSVLKNLMHSVNMYMHLLNLKI